MRALIPLLIILAAAAIGCGTAPLREDEALSGQYHPSGKEEIRVMLGAINEINKKSPDFFAADFNIDGSQEAKKFKLLGTLEYSKKQKMMHIAFLDFIFRSPLTTLFQEGDVIRIYYPSEKRMYIDSMKNINLSNYGGVGINFDLLSGLITGNIPVITDYTVRQGLVANDNRGALLILENSRFYETISFKGNYPDRIKFVNKATRENFEAYIDKPVAQGGTLFFTNIILVVRDARIRLDIKFNRIKLNTPAKVKTHRDITLPADLKVIQM
jgi:hypothetical protein